MKPVFAPQSRYGGRGGAKNLDALKTGFLAIKNRAGQMAQLLSRFFGGLLIGTGDSKSNHSAEGRVAEFLAAGKFLPVKLLIIMAAGGLVGTPRCAGFLWGSPSIKWGGHRHAVRECISCIWGSVGCRSDACKLGRRFPSQPHPPTVYAAKIR